MGSDSKADTEADCDVDGSAETETIEQETGDSVMAVSAQRATYRPSGKIDWARFLPWAGVVLLASVALAGLLHLAYISGFYFVVMIPLAFATGLGFMLCARAAFGDTILANVSETGFGTVGQGAAGINNSGVACGPTSVYNSFVYLQNLDPGLDTKLTALGVANTINTLATDMNLVPGSGISAAGLVSGKSQFISDAGLSGLISVESQVGSGNITAQFIYNQLAMGQDVELGFTWNGASGGHVITLTGMSNFDTTTNTATLSFLDPWGNGAAAEDTNSDPTTGDLEGDPPATPGTTAAAETGTLTFGNGVWTLSYTGSAAGPNGGSGTLVVVAAESVVPEPSTIFLLSAGLVVLLAQRHRHRSI